MFALLPSGQIHRYDCAPSGAGSSGNEGSGRRRRREDGGGGGEGGGGGAGATDGEAGDQYSYAEFVERWKDITSTGASASTSKGSRPNRPSHLALVSSVPSPARRPPSPTPPSPSRSARALAQSTNSTAALVHVAEASAAIAQVAANNTAADDEGADMPPHTVLVVGCASGQLLFLDMSVKGQPIGTIRAHAKSLQIVCTGGGGGGGGSTTAPVAPQRMVTFGQCMNGRDSMKVWLVGGVQSFEQSTGLSRNREPPASFCSLEAAVGLDEAPCAVALSNSFGKVS